MKKFLTLLLLTSWVVSGLAKDGGFLFVTFNSEGSQLGEQIYFGLSQDGIKWEALNGQKPVLVSDIGEKGVRDPYLLRAENGRFYLLATDLSIYLNHNWTRAVQAGSHSIVIWESTNLVNWSEPRLVSVAPADAGCTWAPEAIYDTATKQYLVYWASTTKRDDFKKQRIWGTWTKDFKTFGEPFIYIEKPTTIIDTDIVHAENGKYFRFTKDEKFKAITMEQSESVTGQWADVSGFSLAQVRGYEGPACYLLNPAQDGKPAKWCLLLDNYAQHAGYKPFITDDLASGKFVAGTDFEFPFRFRHGSVLPVSAAEYQRLKTHFGASETPASQK